MFVWVLCVIELKGRARALVIRVVDFSFAIRCERASSSENSDVVIILGVLHEAVVWRWCSEQRVLSFAAVISQPRRESSLFVKRTQSHKHRISHDLLKRVASLG